MFALICIELTVLVFAVVGTLGGLISGDEGVLGALGSFVLLVVLMPVVMAAVIFGSAAIYHLIVILLVKPSHSGFEATFRVLCYAAASALLLAPVALVAWIPVVGVIVNFIASLAFTVYLLFLTVVGIREVHGTTTGRAVLVMLIPSALSLLAYALLLLLGVGILLFFR